MSIDTAPVEVVLLVVLGGAVIVFIFRRIMRLVNNSYNLEILNILKPNIWKTTLEVTQELQESWEARGVTQRVNRLDLSMRLGEFVKQGVVECREIAATGFQAEWRLTQKGIEVRARMNTPPDSSTSSGPPPRAA